MAESEIMSPLPQYFHELQQKRKELENKREQLRIRRKDIEERQDIVSKKNLALSQKKDNMKRTVDVAKRKCQETQHQVDKLQKENDDLQQNIQRMKTAIKSEETKKDALIKNYQEKYGTLADKFRHGIQYYSDPVLNKEFDKHKSSCEEKRTQVKTSEEVVQLISNQLDELQLKTGANCSSMDEKPAKDDWKEFLQGKNVVTRLFQNEHDCAKKIEEELKLTIAELNKSIAEVDVNLKSSSAAK